MSRTDKRLSAAHLAHYPWTGMSSPLSNLAGVLLKRGYANTLYRRGDELVHSARISDISAAAPFDHVHRHQLGRDLGSILNHASRLCGLNEVDRIAVDFVRKIGRPLPERLLVGYDNIGASMAWLSSRFSGSSYVVFSLELSENQHPSRWERRAWRNAMAVIALDTRRGEIVERRYGLRPGSSICVPNSGTGDCYDRPSGMLRDRLGVPAEKRIVLMVGSLIPEHCLREVMGAVPSWPESFALVMHGWGMQPEDLELYEAIRRQCPNRLFFSSDIVAQETKQDVFAGVDIGIVAFTHKTINHRFAGTAAGKLFDFCQAGTPVVASDLPGMREIVEGNSIGRVVPEFEGIGEVLEKLMANRATYRRNCHRFFEQNEFGRRMSAVLDSLRL